MGLRSIYPPRISFAGLNPRYDLYSERWAFEEPTRKGKTVPDDRSVADMVDGVLARQAAYRASQTGESLEDALKIVIETVAGRQLQELRSGPHRHARAGEWQTTIVGKRGSHTSRGEGPRGIRDRRSGLAASLRVSPRT